MISDKTFESIALLAKTINDRGIRLAAVGGSALELLSTAGFRTPVTIEQMSESDLVTHYSNAIKDPMILNIAPENVTKVDGVIPVQEHEETLIAINKTLNKMTDSIINRGRNVVQPFILRVCQAAADIPNRADRLMSVYDLKLIEHYDGWLSPWCQRILGQFSTGNGDAYEPITISLPKAPGTSFIDGELSTGNAEVDELLKNYLVSYGLTEVNVFDLLGNGEIPPASSGEACEYFDKVMFAIILLCAFSDEPWEDTGMDLETYKSVVLDALIALNTWVNDYTDIIKEEAEKKVLIKSIKVEGPTKVIHVNPVSYSNFIAEGGNVKAIYGMMMLLNSGQKDKYYAEYDMIIEHSQHYVGVWEEKVTIDKTRDTHEWLELVKRSMFRAFNQELSVAGEEILPPEVTVEQVLNEFEDYIQENVQIHNVGDIDLLVMEALKATIFKDELSVDILLFTDAYLKDGLDPQEAQKLAILDIVFDYMVSQCVVVDDKVRVI